MEGVRLQGLLCDPEQSLWRHLALVDTTGFRVQNITVGELLVYADDIAFAGDEQARPIVGVNYGLIPDIREIRLRDDVDDAPYVV